MTRFFGTSVPLSIPQIEAMSASIESLDSAISDSTRDLSLQQMKDSAYTGLAYAHRITHVVLLLFVFLCLSLSFAAVRASTGDTQTTLLYLSAFFLMAFFIVQAGVIWPLSVATGENNFVQSTCPHETSIGVRATLVSRAGPAGAYASIKVSYREDMPHREPHIHIHNVGHGITVVAWDDKEGKILHSQSYPVGYHMWNQRAYSPKLAKSIEEVPLGTYVALVVSGTAVPGWGYNYNKIEAPLYAAIRTLGVTVPIEQNQSLGIVGRKGGTVIRESSRRYGTVSFEVEV